jgi:hypothetical protein
VRRFDLGPDRPASSGRAGGRLISRRLGAWPRRLVSGRDRERPSLQPLRARPHLLAGDDGSAVVEFSLVAVLLLILLLSIAQVAVYLFVRNVVTASAAEGARYAANADVDPADGAARASDILARGVGAGTAERFRCTGGVEEGPEAVRLSTVRCAGSLPVFFAPFGDLLPIDVTGHAVEEEPAEVAP